MMTPRPEAIILIPALDPPEKELKELLRALYNLSPGRKILLFNDGSGEEYTPFFQELLAEFPLLLYREHAKNLGKGRTLREGFRFLLEEFPLHPIVTADCDGQHRAEDIFSLAEKIRGENAPLLLLGGRNFSSPDVPLRSRAGNLLTAFFFRLLWGIALMDTQSGLRALTPDLARIVSEECHGDRYEFEMEMLLAARRKRVPIREETIATIYLSGNRGSHFHAFRDSCRILRKLLGASRKN